MKINRTLATLSLSLIVLSAVSLRAQPAASTAVQQLQNFQQNMESQNPLVGLRAGGNAPETYTNENTDIGEQHILRVIPKPKIWQVVADSRFFYTDNATLSQSGNPLTSASMFVNTVSAAYAPTPYKLGVGRFAPAIGYNVLWWNYEGGGSVSGLDFNAQTVFLGAKYMLPQDWTIFGNFDYSRMVNQPHYGLEFYHEYVPSAGVQKLFQPSQNSLFSASLQTDYHFGTVLQPYIPADSQNHLDETLSLVFQWQPVQKVVVQPYYNLTYAYYRFDTAGHNELLNSFGFSVAYYFTQWLSLQAFDNYDVRSSNDTTGSNQGYRAFDLGMELTATFRF